MTDTPPFADLLTLVDDRSAALREAVAAAPDLGARVPGCPDWTLRDLVVHLGRVQRFWAVVVRAGEADAPPPPEARGDMEPHGDLPEWFAASTRLLVDALRETGPDAPSWTWWGSSGAPMTAGAVARHQVQEAAVHAYDAQETIGRPEPVPAAVAVDSVAEFLHVSLGSSGEWPHRPARIAFAAVEGPTWTVDLTPAGAEADPAAAGEPVATVRGAASDLILALFGRVPLDRLQIDGDARVVDELIRWVGTD
jgi:uncharacterized protein (TIGR03083 family)